MKFLMIIAATIFAVSTSFATQVVDLEKSKVNWVGKKKLGDQHAGTVKLKEAKIGKNGKSGEFVIDLSTINVGDLKGEWKQKFEGHMKSDDFFNVSKYPTAKLVVESVTGNKAKGKLTIKGKTQPVSIAYKKKGKSFIGKVKIDRTKFGLIYGSKNFFKKLTADKIIQNIFEISFNVVTK